ncbi:MAG: preprotein translocase subunit SecE [Phormidesmis sp.]
MAKKDTKRASQADGAKTPSKASSKTNPSPKSDSAKGPQPAASESGGFSAGAFAEGTREELTKVIWPTRQQLISESAAVILMVGLSATLIYLVDKLFGWASRLVF